MSRIADLEKRAIKFVSENRYWNQTNVNYKVNTLFMVVKDQGDGLNQREKPKLPLSGFACVSNDGGGWWYFGRNVIKQCININ